MIAKDTLANIAKSYGYSKTLNKNLPPYIAIEAMDEYAKEKAREVIDKIKANKAKLIVNCEYADGLDDTQTYCINLIKQTFDL